MRTRDAMRCCFSVQPRQVVSSDIDLDFGHLDLVAGGES
jgi:hypothetical protein